jgi:membrane protease YdiL (CAAX protease family)
MKNWYPILRILFTWLARIIGIIVLVYCVMTIIDRISVNDTYVESSFEQTIQKIVYMLFLVIASIIIFIIWWIKAKNIAKLKSNNQIMIPVAEYYIRGIGESWATLILCMMIPTVLGIFLFGGVGNDILPLEARTTFLSGLLQLVSNILLAMVVLAISYFLANNLRGREK